MLKHLSRSESRNSNLEDFGLSFDEIEKDNIENEKEEINTEDTNHEISKSDTLSKNPTELLENKNSVDGISILLTKPTIKKIIERRRSELFLKENIQITLKEGEKQKQKTEEKKEPNSPEETIEEVQNETKKLVIYRRKKDPASDTSSESGIASQVSETNNQGSDNQDDNIENLKTSQDFWKLDIDIPPPVSFTSPAVDHYKKRLHHRSQDYLNSNNNQRYEPTKQSHGYSTLDGRVRNKKHLDNRPIVRAESLQRFQQRNIELERVRERSSHQLEHNPNYSRSRVGQSYTMDRRHRHTGANSDYLNELPREPRIQRPHSVGAEMLRYNAYSPNSNSLLVPTNQRHAPNSIKNFNRHDKHRGSSYSVSAGSSVSNIPPQTPRSVGIGSSVSNVIPNSLIRDCGFETLSRRGILEKINEEIEQENELHEAVARRKNISFRRCKYLTMFFIILTLMSCSIGGMLLFFVGHYPQTVYLNQGDVKLVPVSSIWCSGVEVMAKQSSVRAIIFSNEELRSNSTYYKREETFVIEANSVWSRKFFILKGSILSFKVSTQQPVDILTFESMHKYDMWVERKESKTYIEKTSCCQNTPGRFQEVTIHAMNDETHVLAIHRQGAFAEEVTVTMIANRYTYDFTSMSDSCTAQKSDTCSVSYSFNTDDKVAIEVPLDRVLSNKITESVEVEWQCEARTWYYFVVFFVTFLCISGLFTIFYVVFTRWSKLPHDKLCCLKQKHNKAPIVDYYDNFGRTQSDIGTAESQQASSNSSRYLLDPKSKTLKPMYGDNNSSISDSSRYLASLFQHKSATMPRLSRHSTLNENDNNVAAIYKDPPTDIYNEKADSGISIDPNLSPPGQNLNQRELFHLREMEFERLRTLRHHQLQGMELVNAPSIRDLLYRPKSEILGPVPYDLNENIPYNVLQYRQDIRSRGFHSTYDLNLDYPRDLSQVPTRAKSVIGPGDYYDYRDSRNTIQNNETDVYPDPSSHQQTQQNIPYKNNEIYI